MTTATVPPLSRRTEAAFDLVGVQVDVGHANWGISQGARLCEDVSRRPAGEVLRGALMLVDLRRRRSRLLLCVLRQAALINFDEVLPVGLSCRNGLTRLPEELNDSEAQSRAG